MYEFPAVTGSQISSETGSQERGISHYADVYVYVIINRTLICFCLGSGQCPVLTENLVGQFVSL